MAALEIPFDYKYKNNIEKWCLRVAFKNELPEYIIKRRKNPLSHSSGLHEWIRQHKMIFTKGYNKFGFNLYKKNFN